MRGVWQEEELRAKERLEAIKRANEMLVNQTERMKILKSQQLQSDITDVCVCVRRCVLCMCVCEGVCVPDVCVCPHVCVCRMFGVCVMRARTLACMSVGVCHDVLIPSCPCLLP